MKKGSLQCVSEDNCRHRLRPRFNAGITILLSFCRLCIDIPETNMPFVELGHVLKYHLATVGEMARHSSVHSNHKALGAIAKPSQGNSKAKQR